MTTVWRSLLWKEWREHRWKLALVVGACVIVPVSFAWKDVGVSVGVGAMMLTFFVPLAAMAIGAGIAAGEHARGTIAFLQALPVPPWKPALAKLVWAGAIVLAPALTGAALVLGWSLANREGTTLGAAVDALFVLALGAAAFSLLVWIAAAGVNHVDEVRAGVVGLVVITVVWLAVASAVRLATGTFEQPWPRALRIVAAAAPGGIAGALGVSAQATARTLATLAPFAVVALASHGCVIAWYLRRFGRTERPSAVRRSRATRVASPPAKAWLPPPRANSWSAIIWKQFRESAPLGLTGAAAITGLTLVLAAFLDFSDAEVPIPGALLQAAASTWLLLGYFVAIVAGVGVFLDELHPRLQEFWRSRPINVDQWFVVKLASGLAATCLTLAGAPLLIGVTLRVLYGAEGWDFEPGDVPRFLGGGLALQATAYLLAVLAIILVRHAVYAAIIAIAISLAAVAAVGNSINDERLIFAVVVAVAVPLAIAAWQAFRRDWGWKG